jgi:hypothetical protein
MWRPSLRVVSAPAAMGSQQSPECGLLFAGTLIAVRARRFCDVENECNFGIGGVTEVRGSHGVASRTPRARVAIRVVRRARQFATFAAAGAQLRRTRRIFARARDTGPSARRASLHFSAQRCGCGEVTPQ